MKNKTSAGLLAIFLGGFGAHHYYLGNSGKGTTYLLVSLLTCGVGAFVISILSIVDAVRFFSMSDDEFNATYNGAAPAPQQAYAAQPTPPPAQTAVKGNNMFEKLKQAKELLDAGAITQEEFDEMKANILEEQS